MVDSVTSTSSLSTPSNLLPYERPDPAGIERFAGFLRHRGYSGIRPILTWAGDRCRLRTTPGQGTGSLCSVSPVFMIRARYLLVLAAMAATSARELAVLAETYS